MALCEVRRTEAAAGGFMWKKVFLKILQILQENTSVGVFLIKLQVFGPTILLKSDFNADVFVWNLRKF